MDHYDRAREGSQWSGLGDERALGIVGPHYAGIASDAAGIPMPAERRSSIGLTEGAGGDITSADSEIQLIELEGVCLRIGDGGQAG